MTSKDSHDPGWNDPPIFTYDKAAAIQAAAATKKGISLNKRVAFPISSNLNNQQQNAQANCLDLSKPPPMSQPPPFSLPPCVKSEPAPETKVKLGSKEKLEKLIQNLQVEANCDEEILKRIKVMENMWIDGKLEEMVQSRLFELGEALVKGDTDAADRIQMSLMVDYVSQCSSWMSAIRHLINRKKKLEVQSEA